VGIGYNGMPNRCSDDELPWKREAEDRLDTKYPYGKYCFRVLQARMFCGTETYLCESLYSFSIYNSCMHCTHTVCHAELNAILNKNSADVKGCTMYVALFPCNECAKLIIQSGISEVLYVSDKHHDRPEMVASRRLLDMAGVKYR